jgi:hypothetical protein
VLAQPSSEFGRADPCQQAWRRSPRGWSPHPRRPRWRGCYGLTGGESSTRSSQRAWGRQWGGAGQGVGDGAHWSGAMTVRWLGGGKWRCPGFSGGSDGRRQRRREPAAPVSGETDEAH